MPNGERYTDYERGYHAGLKRAEKIARDATPAANTKVTWEGCRNRIANLIKKELWRSR